MVTLEVHKDPFHKRQNQGWRWPDVITVKLNIACRTRKGRVMELDPARTAFETDDGATY